ncbi:hypothetical protein NW767_011917 [Fusarium falciforme]|nr:hypothetical protein NW767_011917 [Fusarium falciforme]
MAGDISYVSDDGGGEANMGLEDLLVPDGTLTCIDQVEKGHLETRVVEDGIGKEQCDDDYEGSEVDLEEVKCMSSEEHWTREASSSLRRRKRRRSGEGVTQDGVGDGGNHVRECRASGGSTGVRDLESSNPILARWEVK